MKGNRIPAIMRKKRNPAMSDEEIKASIDAANSDYQEQVDPNNQLSLIGRLILTLSKSLERGI